MLLSSMNSCKSSPRSLTPAGHVRWNCNLNTMVPMFSQISVWKDCCLMMQPLYQSAGALGRPAISLLCSPVWCSELRKLDRPAQKPISCAFWPWHQCRSSVLWSIVCCDMWCSMICFMNDVNRLNKKCVPLFLWYTRCRSLMPVLWYFAFVG